MARSEKGGEGRLVRSVKEGLVIEGAGRREGRGDCKKVVIKTADSKSEGRKTLKESEQQKRKRLKKRREKSINEGHQNEARETTREFLDRKIHIWKINEKRLRKQEEKRKKMQHHNEPRLKMGR